VDGIYGMGNNIANAWNSGSYGQGNVIGNTTIAAASLAVPFAKSAPAAGYTMANRGSTALTAANSSSVMNLRQQLAIEQAMSRPMAGKPVPISLKDTRWPASEGWMKMEQIIYPGGDPVKVHYNLNKTLQLMDDFKIKTL
jgi:filamentous hemagglutinin